jgi:hypothetical protein
MHGRAARSVKRNFRALGLVNVKKSAETRGNITCIQIFIKNINNCHFLITMGYTYKKVTVNAIFDLRLHVHFEQNLHF